MSTFLIVHGAWAGAWGWDRVARRLRTRGHDVHVPALSGLGERSHLAQLPITLSHHVADIVNEALWHDLTDIVLVAHSYGGIVGTMAAEQLGERVSALVFVESFIPEDGQSFADIAGAQFEGPTVPAPPIGPNDYLNPADVQMATARVTPQPVGTFTEPARVTGSWQAIGRKSFVVATGWDGPFGQIAGAYRDQPGWTVTDLPCGHDVPLDLPDELAALLEQA
jgi:pimeloyl-ACP methyl ester carboxylesterase